MGIAEAVRSVAEAVKAIFAFLVTPEGQATVKAWREGSDRWNTAIEKAVLRFESLVK